MITLHGRIVARQVEYGGYITYVFKNEEPVDYYTRFIACTRYPNWECGSIELNQLGYLTIEEHQAGKDEWFDGKEYWKYKHDHIQFIQFVPEPNSLDNVITL